MKASFLLVFVWTLAGQPAAEPGSIAGQAVNAVTGAPLRKVNVQLLRGVEPLEVETDEQGRFEFAGLAAGSYSLFAHRTGFLRLTYGARRPGGPGNPVAVAPGQRVDGLVLRLTPQGVIAGRVLDEDGDPVAFTQVGLYQLTHLEGRKEWTQVHDAPTSDTGEFRVASLEPGRYVVGAMAPRRGALSRYEESLPAKPEMVYSGTFYPGALSPETAAAVEVAAGTEIHGIDIRMARVAAYRLRGAVAGIAPGQDANHLLTLIPKQSTMNGAWNFPVLSVGNRFEIRGVPAGDYTLFAEVTGGTSPKMAGYLPVTVSSGHLTGLVVALAPPFDLPVQVSMAEADSTVAVKDVFVSVVQVLPGTAGPNLNQTGEDGRLTVKGLWPGRYAVYVPKPPDGCFVQAVKYGGQAVTAEDVEIAGPALLEVVLSATAATIGGQVLDKDGKTVPQAAVALISGTGVEATTADENGNFRFEHLRPGTYKLLAWADIERGAEQDPEFRKPFEAAALEVVMGPGEAKSVSLHTR